MGVSQTSVDSNAEPVVAADLSFAQESHALLVTRSRAICVFAASMIVLVGIFDALTFPELVGDSVVIRGILVALYALWFIALRQNLGKGLAVALSASAFLVMMWELKALTQLHADINVLNIALVVILAYAMTLPWDPIVAGITTASGVLMALLGVAYLLPKPGDLETLAMNLGTACAVAVYLAWLLRKLRRREFDLRSELKKQLQWHVLARQLESDLRERDDRLMNIGRTAKALVHDLRNPLMAISGYTELAQVQSARARPEKVSESLEEIHRVSKRMASMVDDILDYARDPQTPPAPTVKDINPADTAD